jgi:hypothetical protein
LLPISRLVRGPKPVYVTLDSECWASPLGPALGQDYLPPVPTLSNIMGNDNHDNAGEAEISTGKLSGSYIRGETKEALAKWGRNRSRFDRRFCFW